MTAQTTIQNDRLAAETTTTADVQPSIRIVEAVAEATDADPVSMAPLYEAIDPDALDALFADGIQGCVQFTYDGHEVTAHGDGTIVVDGEAVGR